IGIGEVDIAVGSDPEVVGAVQVLPFKLLKQDFHLFVVVDEDDPVLRIGTGNQLIVRVDIQTVGPSGTLQPQGDASLLFPAVDAVVGLVSEVNAAVFGDSGAFGKGVAGSDLL